RRDRPGRPVAGAAIDPRRALARGPGGDRLPDRSGRAGAGRGSPLAMTRTAARGTRLAATPSHAGRRPQWPATRRPGRMTLTRLALVAAAAAAAAAAIVGMSACS